jgi:Flp pilus assembly protein TadG
MNKSFGSTSAARRNERGAARLKFIIVLVVVLLAGYMGFQFIPVAYQSYTFKKLMDDTADQVAASALPTDQKGAWVENQLRTSAKDYGVPPDAKMTHIFQNNRMEITVKFTRQVNLLPGLWTYQYDFDHTAKSSTLLTPQ